jgi:Right handed beta helix region
MTAKLLLASVLGCSTALALAADPITRVIDCTRGDTIQRHIDKRNPDRELVLVIRGACTENVVVDRDDVTLIGEGGTVNGNINLVGARRAIIRALTVTNPVGAGISATDNASVTIEDSTLERNGTNGLDVRNGAQATVLRSRLSQNGQAQLPDSGRGIHASHGGSVDARNNTIVNNRSDGVGINNNSYGRLTENTIEGNGRFAAGEAGIQVNRSRVRANGNIVRNNTGSAAIIVVNSADYRTGTAVNAADFPDNEFAFERIEHAVGPGLLALDVNQGSYGDFRQVHIVGSIAVGAQTMMQVRGDEVGPNQVCSTINPNGGFIAVSNRNSFLRLRFTQGTGGLPPSPFIEIVNPCPVVPPPPPPG